MTENQSVKLAEFTQDNLQKLQAILRCVKNWQELETSQWTGVVVIPKSVLEQSGLVSEEVPPLLAALNKKMGEVVLLVEEEKYVLTRGHRSESTQNEMTFSYPELQKLLDVQAEVDELLKRDDDAVVKNGKITEVVLVEQENRAALMRIVVNGDYKRPLGIKSPGKPWVVLMKIAQGQRLPAEDHKDVKDYINSNKHNPLYARGGYAPVTILETRGGLLYGTSILGKPISESAYKRRLNSAE